jgi:hypothetical protein
MSLTITWNRHGTATSPRYVGGAIVNGEVGTVSDDDFERVLRQAWEKFMNDVLPLNAAGGWNVIRCHLNFSAGGLTISVARAEKSNADGIGEVYVVTGNFAEVWTRAAPLDDGNAGPRFRGVIEKAMEAFAPRILGAVARVAPQLHGQAVSFTCVGTSRILWGSIGGDTCTDSGPVIQKNVPDSADNAGIQWSIQSDIPGHVLYVGTAAEAVSEEEYEGALLEMWRLFANKVVPLNDADSWDHVRCELALNAGYIAVYVAVRPFDQRVDAGTCKLELTEFSDIWEEF